MIRLQPRSTCTDTLFPYTTLFRSGVGDLLQEHIISPAPTTERLQSIQRMVADQLGDAIPSEFSANVLQSIPVQAGGLYPISDVWYIDPGLDSPDRLRTHIEQFAREIRSEERRVGKECVSTCRSRWSPVH